MMSDMNILETECEILESKFVKRNNLEGIFRQISYGAAQAKIESSASTVSSSVSDEIFYDTFEDFDFNIDEALKRFERRRHSSGGSAKAYYSKGYSSSPSPTLRSTSSSPGVRAKTKKKGPERLLDWDFDFVSVKEELEEPFSSSEDEDEVIGGKKSSKAKFLLPLPRRRIRTLSGTIPPVGYAPVFGGPTMCLACFEFFDLPKDTTSYVGHLLDKHAIVIDDIELIVDLKRYVEYWRHRYTSGESVEKIFPKVVPGPNDPVKGKVESYYLMSEKLEEDMQIRERLALRRLEEVLACQQREREDRGFNRQCLFCRYKVKGNRTKLIHHLYTIHHLNLGSPDNLVFINEYLDILQYRLDNNQCLYCEKFFPDHNTLMDHMRKKQHREVNPKNSYYDKFYVINYLELGKKWLEVLAEDFEDSMPTFVDSEDEEEEESWNEWQEDNTEENVVTIMCLFCDTFAQDVTELVAHMASTHNFDFREFVKKHKLSYYQQVKFVNYIRRLALRKHLAEADHLTKLPPEEKWLSDENLIPYFDNDYLLCSLEEAVGLAVANSRHTSLESGDVFTEPVTTPTVTTGGAAEAVNGVEAHPPTGSEGDGDGSRAVEDGKGATWKSPEPVVIPEDLPEMGEALKDAGVRESLGSFA